MQVCGHRPISGECPEPVFASEISIPAETNISEAIRKIFQSSFQHAMANLPVYLQTGHIESVHQLRVGLRRFRAGMSAFSPILDLKRPAGLTMQMKLIFDDLGPIRDADVFLDETLEAILKLGLPSSYEAMLREEITDYR